MKCARRGTKGFSLTELVVIIGIVGALLALQLPMVHLASERDNRAKCMSNLHEMGTMLRAYETDYKAFPRTNSDGTGKLVTYTPASDKQGTHPFIEKDGSPPDNNDVTAAYWLLARTCDINPAKFICPSTADVADPMLKDKTQMTPATRVNFTSDANNSYSFYNEYPTPAQISGGMPRWSGSMDSAIAVVADKNPGAKTPDPGISAAADAMRAANSLNHAGAGQCILYADAHSEWNVTPYCGSKLDNIYISGPGTGSKAEMADDSYLLPKAGGGI